jgi:acyl-coenzyme A synthetase/AMP-(fatty) acid ligase
MLYERWLETVRAAPHRRALWEGAADRNWTFAELAAAAAGTPAGEGPCLFANASGSAFILSILAGWREGKVVVPLEPGQPQPEIFGMPGKKIIHLKSTSASTGKARMISFTAEQLVADCENIVASMGLSSALANVGAISLAHSYGFSNLVLPCLLKGIPLLLAASALPESVRVAIDQASSVALPSVPALWKAWSDAGIIGRRVEIAISAGAPLPLPLEREVFESAGVKIHNFYGSSECGGIAYDRTPVPRPDASLAGSPLAGVAVGVNAEGCLTVQSEAAGTGYWPEPNPELSDSVFQTGDLGEVRDGSVYLRGRACDRINVAGRKLVPEEVERAISLHPAVKDSLVFGVPSDNLRNETIVACLTLSSKVSPRELTEFLQSRLPSWQVPREWRVVDSLGVNERGKRSRAEWRQRYLDEYRRPL